jgi:hypothetical protein
MEKSRIPFWSYNTPIDKKKFSKEMHCIILTLQHVISKMESLGQFSASSLNASGSTLGREGRRQDVRAGTQSRESVCGTAPILHSTSKQQQVVVAFGILLGVNICCVSFYLMSYLRRSH